VEIFLRENNFIQLDKDLKEEYKKVIRQTLYKNPLLIEKQSIKYLMQIKPLAPSLKTQLKIHKENI
jgi:hypothetical protein